jgi:Protein of unknown function (DUF1592)/Protein of unknown function (DUF1588)/Protein of unknown function (DUF1587)/Protein of unknown function (DUF1595)/Protein of unknown function (DUF1585)
MAMRRLTAASMLLGTLVLTAACNGSISGGASQTGGPGPASGGAPGGSGSSTGVGSVGAAGTGSSTGSGQAGAQGSNGTVDPPPTLMRRLTNAEYSNAVSDLLGEPTGADVRFDLPEDPRGYGFDNDAEVETITSVHADRYSHAAETMVASVLGTPARRTQVLGCDPATGAACLTSIIQHFGRLAYRRPLTPAEVTGYLATATAAGTATPNDGVSAILQAMLASPYFLFRVELGSPDPQRAGLLRLTGFEMATRLSFFLRGTTPDDGLLDSAQKGQLDTVVGIAAAANQMLADPRAKAAVNHFYTQWLQLDDLASTSIDATKYKLWNPALQSAMAEESSRFVDSIIWTDGTSFLDLLTARYTYVNGALAAVYGLPAGDGTWHRVDFPATSPRVGILTQASVLTLTSHSQSVSPTKRGLYVRSQLLCGQVPSPPPGVAGSPPPAVSGETERQQFARHTTVVTCAACHTLMDPIGWGLSQFDVIGNIRTVDAQNQPVAVDGLISGFTPPEFNGPVELAQRLRQSEEFAACVGTSLYRFAYGQSSTGQASSVIGEIEGAFKGQGYDFRKTLVALVSSDAFRYRKLPTGPAAGGMP